MRNIELHLPALLFCSKSWVSIFFFLYSILTQGTGNTIAARVTGTNSRILSMEKDTYIRCLRMKKKYDYFQYCSNSAPSTNSSNSVSRKGHITEHWFVVSYGARYGTYQLLLFYFIMFWKLGEMVNNQDIHFPLFYFMFLLEILYRQLTFPFGLMRTTIVFSHYLKIEVDTVAESEILIRESKQYIDVIQP